MSKSALFTVSLFLIASAVAGVKPVSPVGGVKVSLLRPEQQAYLALPVGARHDRLRNEAARREMAKCGGRPAPVRLEWKDDAPDPKAVYEVALKVADGVEENFVVSNATSVTLVNLEVGREYLWRVGRAGTKEMSEAASFRTSGDFRLVFIPGVVNCRDLGGRKGYGGKLIRQGQLYRTSGYNFAAQKIGTGLLDSRYVVGGAKITPNGRRELVKAFGVRTDVDLRSEVECAGMVASPLGSDVKWVHVPVRAYEWLDNDKPALAKVLKACMDAKRRPLAFHCAGGRDRAGSVAFILAGLLGASEDDLRKDWELSTFETDDMQVVPERFEGLMTMLSRYPGANVNQRIEGFVKACGITDAEIAEFRIDMMEP